MNKFAILSVCLLCSLAAYGQTNFRTNGTGGGNWNQNSTWEVETPNGFNIWLPASSTPTSASHNITIRTGDLVTVTVDVSLDQTVVQAGASLTINDGIVLALSDGIGINDFFALGNVSFLGESFVNGSGFFTMSAGSHLFLGSLNGTGAIVTGTTLGNLRITGRGFSSASQITYNGAGPQFIGNGHPGNSVETFIDNPAGVSLNNTTQTTVTIGDHLNIVNGTLTVQNNSLSVIGNLIANDNIIFSSSSVARTITVSGNLDLIGGDLSATSGATTAGVTVIGNLNLTGGTATLTSGTAVATLSVTGILNLASNDLTIVSSGTANATANVTGDITGGMLVQSSGSNSNFAVNGTGALTNSFPFASGATFELITWNRSGGLLTFPYSLNLKDLTISAGNVSTNVALVLSGSLNIASGSLFTFDGQDLTIQAAFNNLLSGGFLDADNTSNLNITGSGTLGTLAFSPSGNSLNNLTLNRPTPANLVTLNSTLTIVGALNLTDGDFLNTSGLSMGSGAMINRNSNAAFSGAGPTGGPYDVTYSGTFLTTGSELGGANLRDITSNSSASVTLGATFTAAGALTINSGTVTCGAIGFVVGSIVNLGTLNAPSTNISISGDFNNSGTFNRNNGTITFTGNSSILGTTTPIFHTVTITGILNGGTGLALTGNFTNNGTFNGGTSVVQFLGSIAQAIQGTSSSAFASFTVIKTVATTLTISSAVTVTDGVNLTVGRLDNASGLLTMIADAIFTRNSGTTYIGLAPAGGPYDLTYNGTFLTTSAEAQGSLDDVTINVSISVTPGTVISIPGTLTLNSGNLANATNRISMGNGADIVRVGTATFTGVAPSGGPYDLTYLLTTNLSTGFEARGSLRNVTNNSTSIVTVAAAMPIPGTLTLNSGTLSNASGFVNMGNGSTIARNGTGLFTGVAPAGGPYDLIYGGTSYATGVEKLGSLDDVTSNMTGTLTLSNSLTAPGTLSVNSGVWDSGANTMFLGEVSILGTLIAPSTQMTLTGDFSDDGIFTHNSGTVIFDGTTTFPGGAVTNLNHLQLNASRTLTLPAAISVAGNATLTSGSTFNHGNGVVTVNGSATQNFDAQGSRFFGITVSKAGGSVELLSSLDLANVLSFTTATVFNSAGFLTVLSQPAGPGDDTGNDASIGSLAVGASVTGNVSVQRFMLTKGLNNKYVSSAVIGTGQSELSDDMTILSGYVRLYNEPSPGSNANGYLNLTSGSYPLTPGRGYLVFLGDGTNIQWDVLGSINSGDVAMPVSYTTTAGGPLNDGWNLAGNPYPSPIQWNNNPAAWSRSNVDPVATVYETTGSSIANGGTGITTNFFTCNFTNGAGNLPNCIIAGGQAFWVHLSAPGSLTVREDAKNGTPGGRFLREVQTPVKQLIVSLSGEGFTDHSFLILDDNATKNYDRDYDGYKFKNEFGNIYFIDPLERHLVMNATDKLDFDLEIPLGVAVGATGEYRISFSGADQFPLSGDLFFIDSQEGVAIPVAELSGKGYPVYLSGQEMEVNERFYLSFSKQIRKEKAGPLVFAFPNPTKDFVTIEAASSTVTGVSIFDVSGNSLATGTSANVESIDMRSYPNGLYFLRIVTSEGVIVKKILKHN